MTLRLPAALLAVGALSLSGCRQPRAPPPPEAAASVAPDVDPALQDLSWTTTSSAGHVVVTQTASARDVCVCTAALEGTPVWSVSTCLGKRLDLRFISEDGHRLVVLHPLPDKGGDWRLAPVAHVYDDGRAGYTVRAAGVMREAASTRSAGAQFYWMEGVLGQPGAPPRYGEDARSVKLHSLDGREQTFPLVK